VSFRGPSAFKKFNISTLVASMASKSSTATVSPINNSSLERINENVEPIINDWVADPLNLFFRTIVSEKGLEVDGIIDETLCGVVETNEARFTLEVAFLMMEISSTSIELSDGILILQSC
jgi:hypothetical protein